MSIVGFLLIGAIFLAERPDWLRPGPEGKEALQQDVAPTRGRISEAGAPEAKEPVSNHPEASLTETAPKQKTATAVPDASAKPSATPNLPPDPPVDGAHTQTAPFGSSADTDARRRNAVQHIPGDLGMKAPKESSAIRECTEAIAALGLCIRNANGTEK